MKTENTSFAYRKFKSLCEERNLKARQVSLATGISTASLSQWKSGEYNFKLEKLTLIAKFFGVPITEFME